MNAVHQSLFTMKRIANEATKTGAHPDVVAAGQVALSTIEEIEGKLGIVSENLETCVYLRKDSK